MRYFFKLVFIIFILGDSAQGERVIYTRKFGNTVRDTTYNYAASVYSSGGLTGGFTYKVTQATTGTSTAGQINGYYLIQGSFDNSNWSTINRTESGSSTRGQVQMGGSNGGTFTGYFSHEELATWVGDDAFETDDNNKLYFRLKCNSSCNSEDIVLINVDDVAYTWYDINPPTLSSVAISSNNNLGTISNGAIAGDSYDFRQFARAGDVITLTFSSSEDIAAGTAGAGNASAAPVVTIAGETAGSVTASDNDWTATYTVTTDATEGNAAISIVFYDDSGNQGTTVTSINTCTNCSSSVTVDHTVPTVSSAAMENSTPDAAVQTTSYVNDDDEISLTVEFSEAIFSTPVITAGGQAMTASTEPSGTDWTYTRALGTDETNEALLAIAIDATVAGSPQTSVLDKAGNYLASDYTTAPSGQLYYDRTHPTISTVSIASNNSIGSTVAKPLDVVTVTIAANENLHASPTMTVEGTAATVSQGADATAWSGAVTMNATSHSNDSEVELTVDCYDKSGNACTQATATTNGTAVSYNETAPALEDVRIYSNNGNTDYAKTGNDITLVFDDDDETTTLTSSIAVTIAGATVSSGNIATNTNFAKYTATHTMAGSETAGVIPFTINLTDLHGNAMTEVTAEVGDGASAAPSSVTYDKTAPTITSLTIECDTDDAECTDAAFAKDGSKVVVTLVAAENLDADTDATGTIMSINATGGNTPTAAAPTTVIMYATMTGGSKGIIDFDIDAVTDSSANVTNNITKTSITDGTSVMYDDDVPVISGTVISIPTDGAYFNEGDNLDFIYQVTNGSGGANEGIRITGAPRVEITLASGTVYADYHAASSTLSTGRLAFRYTVSDGDTDTDGLVYSRTISENDGTINDSSYNAIVYANALPEMGNDYYIDTTAPTVSKVDTRNTVDDKTYKAGDVVRIGVIISEQVTVSTAAGTPTLELVTQTGNNSLATYAAISANSSGNDTLFFDYTVAAGDASTDLNYAATSSLVMSGGVVQDLAGNNLTVTLPDPSSGTAENLAKNSAIVVDGIAPTVSLVTANRAADTHWPADSVIVVYVDFSEDVAVTTAGGTPQLTLKTKTDGSTTALAYNSTVGNDSISFNYTVAAGDGVQYLDYAATNSLDLNSGTIKDAAGNNATLTLDTPGATNSLAGKKKLTVDTQGPTVVSVTKDGLGGDSGTAAGYYNESNYINFHVNFTDDFSSGDDIVTISTTGGTPTVTLETREDGATDPSATLYNNRGSGSLYFRYTISHPESSTALDYVATTSLALNGGTIRDKAGNDATLTLPALGGGASLANDVTYVIDTDDPDIERITSTATNGTYKVGDVIPIIVDMNEVVYLGGYGNPGEYTADNVPLLQLETGDVEDGTATYVSGSGNDSLIFNYTVGTNHESLDLDYLDSVPFNWTGKLWYAISDRSGNYWNRSAPSNPGGTNSLGVLKDLVIDGVVPSIDSVSTTTDDGYYNAGDTVDVVVYGSEKLAVTGSPKITLETGDSDAQVSFTSGSSTKQLSFQYIVASGHNSSDLDYADTLSLSVDDGTIRDLAGNDLTLTLAVPGQAGSISANSAIVVDTEAPACSLVYVNVTQSQLNKLGKGEDRLDLKAMFNEKIKSSPTFSVFWPVTTDSTYINEGFTGSEDDDSTWTYTITSLPTATTYTGNITVRVSASDLAGNLLSSVVDTSAFFLDTTPPAAFTTGSVTPGGSVPKARWFNKGTDSLTVEYPIQNSDLTLTQGKAQPRMQIENVGGSEVVVGSPDTLTNTSLTTQSVIINKQAVFDAIGANFFQGAKITTWIDLYDRANNLTAGAVSLDTLTIDTIPPVKGSFVSGNVIEGDTLISSDSISVTATGFTDAVSGIESFDWAVGKFKEARYTELDSIQEWTTKPGADTLITGAAPLRDSTFHRLSIRALDNAGNRSDTLSTNLGFLRLNTAPVITAIDTVEVKEEDSLSYFVAVTDPDLTTLLLDTTRYYFYNSTTLLTSDTLALKAGSPVVEINSITGEITWTTPYHGDTTYYPISLKILDNTNRNDTEDFLLQVNENTKPKFTQLAYIALSGDSAKTSVPDTLKMWENDTLVVTFTLDDLDDDTLTYSVTADSSELKLVVLDSSVTTTPKEIQVTFMPEQFWRKTSKIKLRASDGKVNGATRNNDTTFVMNVKHVPRPHYWLSLGQNPSFTRYYELMVTDTAEKAKGLDMYIYRDGNLPVGAVEMDSLGLYTWVGNFEFDTTANYRFEMKGDGLVGDTTVNDTATHALARASGPWRAESYDGGFTVISKAANAVPFDKPFMIVDSLLFPVGEAEDGLYRMGHPLVEFEKPVMVTILADERYPAAEQAIHQMSGGVWQELPTISRKNEIMAWTKSMGYFKIGEKTIIVPEETLLGSNYPNPFNSSTNVEFDVGFFGGPDQRIVVVIYNILGQRVKTLHDGPLAIGHHKIRWNARDMRESPVSSGLYIIRLLSDAGVTQSKKMTLIR